MYCGAEIMKHNVCASEGCCCCRWRIYTALIDSIGKYRSDAGKCEGMFES